MFRKFAKMDASFSFSGNCSGATNSIFNIFCCFFCCFFVFYVVPTAYLPTQRRSLLRIELRHDASKLALKDVLKDLCLFLVTQLRNDGRISNVHLLSVSALVTCKESIGAPDALAFGFMVVLIALKATLARRDGAGVIIGAACAGALVLAFAAVGGGMRVDDLVDLSVPLLVAFSCCTARTSHPNLSRNSEYGISCTSRGNFVTSTQKARWIFDTIVDA